MYNPGSDNYSESRIIADDADLNVYRRLFAILTPQWVSLSRLTRNLYRAGSITWNPCGWVKHDMSRYNVSLSRITIGSENAMTDCSPCLHSPIRGQVNRCRKHYLIQNKKRRVNCARTNAVHLKTNV